MLQKGLCQTQLLNVVTPYAKRTRCGTNKCDFHKEQHLKGYQLIGKVNLRKKIQPAVKPIKQITTKHEVTKNQKLRLLLIHIMKQLSQQNTAAESKQRGNSSQLDKIC